MSRADRDDAGVDDLLDELDGLLSDSDAKGSRKPSRTPLAERAAGGGGATAPAAGVQPRAASSSLSSRNAGDDIDSLLAQLDGDVRSPPSRSDAARAPTAQSAVAVGAAPSGGDDSTATMLRCAKCDWKVLRFDDHEWAPAADYMFFRNSMPNLAKLREMLRRNEGICAYACQCDWVSVDETRPHGKSHWFPIRSAR